MVAPRGRLVNAREIKRRAWWDAAAVLQNAIDSGWEWEKGLSDADALRFGKALGEVVAEMERKGRGS